MDRVRYLQASASCDALVLRVSDTRSRTQSRTKLGESLTRRAQIPQTPEEIRIRQRNGRGRSTTGRTVFLLLFLLFAICLSAIASWGKQVNTTTAKVEGTVFIQDSAGNQSLVAGASVKLKGPATFATESDENCKYVIASAPLATYTIQAVSPGFKSLQEVYVEA